MVVRLSLGQVVPAIRALVPRLAGAYPWPVKPDVEHLAKTWRHLESLGSTRTYGLYDSGVNIRGILLGLIVPDMITGELQGLEYMWFVEPGLRGKRQGVKLLRRFEEDCREAKCVRVVCGFAEWLNPEEMHLRYAKLGYEPHSRIFSKKL